MSLEELAQVATVTIISKNGALQVVMEHIRSAATYIAVEDTDHTYMLLT